MAQLPVLDDRIVVLAISPPDPNPPAPRKWTFSFRYWRQIEYFGFDRTNAGWFASLLERLVVLSNEDVDKFICNPQKIDVWRYHRIDWGHKNIPVQLKDLDWLPRDIRDNEEEFFLVQFQISKALGRVVGFWSQDYVFNIVLLDPLHNIQPSKDYNYRVDPCNPLSCDYTKLINSLDLILEYHCSKRKCDIAGQIQAIPTNKDSLLHSNVVMIKMTDDEIGYARLLIDEDKIKSFSDLVRDGLKHHLGS